MSEVKLIVTCNQLSGQLLSSLIYTVFFFMITSFSLQKLLEEKERKPPKERAVKPSRTGLCKSGQSAHGPTTKSRNAATKGYNKRIYTTGKGNVWSKK